MFNLHEVHHVHLNLRNSFLGRARLYFDSSLEPFHQCFTLFSEAFTKVFFTNAIFRKFDFQCQYFALYGLFQTVNVGYSVQIQMGDFSWVHVAIGTVLIGQKVLISHPKQLYSCRKRTHPSIKTDD